MPDNEPITYGIRFSPEAEQNATEIAHIHLERTIDAAGAIALHRFFYEESGKLSVFPDAWRVEEDESVKMGCEVRRILVRRGFRGWHMFYRIENQEDGPIVRILCIRDARIPLSMEEAERIMSNQ